MESITLFRVIKTGMTNFYRNFWLSATATLIMIITLAILTLTLVSFNITRVAIQNIQERVDISVYFKAQVSEQQILDIQGELQQLPEIASVKYVSAADALASFREKHSDNQLIQDSLGQLTDNPLPPTLQVKAKNLNDYPKIAEELSKVEYSAFIDKVNFQDNRSVIERLSRILSAVKRLGVSMAVVFCFIAILVIFNTIRLTIFNRREEVEIMKLVGATNWYIRWPFIIESIMYALAASIITILFTIPIFNYLLPRLNSYLGTNLTNDTWGFNLWIIFAIQLVTALILGIISSTIAIRRYLRI
ncbi:MAG: cell division transport system permease protein [Candidatus Doudnabacteria bacterium Gr01-1014_77]|uniref:Cell division protein FtsX n=1 Tax=Candidatus Doudnabacteria bacterium Gr01-1014_77 TaxID=2017133 RepID=A0A554JD17_9BACT|nr:MAG: cell division transport system permease protein [Candidatus Doudnabacteria bacterium Gr01-1014_77]